MVVEKALFIDAENISHHCIENVINKLGHVAIKKAYGNWGAPHLAPWRSVCERLAIEMIYQHNLPKSKSNSADIALSVGVMEALFIQPIDTFIIASSDSDFSPLIHYLRISGKQVYGVGKPETLCRAHFDKFICINEQVKKAAVSTNISTSKDFLELAKHAVEIKQHKYSGFAELAEVGNFLSKEFKVCKKRLGVKKLVCFFEHYSRFFEITRKEDGSVLVALKV